MTPEVPNEDQADLDSHARLLRLADERGDFVRGDDGYTYYWPTNEASRGCLPSWALRALADEMDKRDTTWDAIISGDHRIGPGCVQTWKWDVAPEEWKKKSTHEGNERWIALVPEHLMEERDHPLHPLDWMNWYPGAHQVSIQRLSKDDAPDGFEIWIGAHA